MRETETQKQRQRETERQRSFSFLVDGRVHVKNGPEQRELLTKIPEDWVMWICRDDGGVVDVLVWSNSNSFLSPLS